MTGELPVRLEASAAARWNLPPEDDDQNHERNKDCDFHTLSDGAPRWFDSLASANPRRDRAPPPAMGLLHRRTGCSEPSYIVESE